MVNTVAVKRIIVKISIVNSIIINTLNQEDLNFCKSENINK